MRIVRTYVIIGKFMNTCRLRKKENCTRSPITVGMSYSFNSIHIAMYGRTQWCRSPRVARMAVRIKFHFEGGYPVAEILIEKILNVRLRKQVVIGTLPISNEYTVYLGNKLCTLS